VLAYLLNPLVSLMMRLRLTRGLAVFVTYLVLFSLLGGASLLISRVIAEAANFVSLVPDAFAALSRITSSVQAWATRWLERLPFIFSDRLGSVDPNGALGAEIRDRLIALLQDWGGSFATTLEGIVTRGPSILFSGASAVISVTLQIALILLASIYFL